MIATARAMSQPDQYGPPVGGGGAGPAPMANGWRPPKPSRTSPPAPPGVSATPRAMSQPGQYGPPDTAAGSGSEPTRNPCRPPQPSTTKPPYGTGALGRT